MMSKVELAPNCIVYHGDCLEVLKDLSGIHACVTDPPYNLTSIVKRFSKKNAAPCKYGKDGSFSRLSKGFMGQEWDGSGVSFNPETWELVYNTLLPGGHLVSFAGTRTYHRIACAIEDAGFEVRDMLSWIYGCLSEDTSLINQEGKAVSYKAIKPKDQILVYDKYTKEFFYSEVEKVYEYNIKNTCYRIQSDSTDQIVSRNHRCLIERDGKEVFVLAEDLQKKENIPVLENLSDLHETISSMHTRASNKKQNLFSGVCKHLNFQEKDRSNKANRKVASNHSNMSSMRKRIRQKHKTIKESQNSGLQFEMQWNFERQRVGKTCSQRPCRMDTRIGNSTKTADDRGNESCMERWGNLSKKSWKSQRGKIHSVSVRIFVNGKKRWICNGTSFSYGKTNRKILVKNGSRSSYRPRFVEQCNRKFNVVSFQCGTQGIREWTGYKTTLATITPFEYEGTIWCVKVKTGAFVAVRNGKAFVTGNSGFPKSHNVSKAIDEMKGMKPEVIGTVADFAIDGRKRKTDNSHTPTVGFNGVGSGSWGSLVTAASSKEAKQWEGWGTALKPACEPICFARKPLSEKIVAANVLEHGTGAININACRLDEVVEGFERKGKRNNNIYGKDERQNTVYNPNNLGRWPANIIHDGSEEVLEHFPETQSGTLLHTHKRNTPKTKGIYGSFEENTSKNEYFCNSGSAARFFYCAKASSEERDYGLENFFTQEVHSNMNSHNGAGVRLDTPYELIEGTSQAIIDEIYKYLK